MHHTGSNIICSSVIIPAIGTLLLRRFQTCFRTLEKHLTTAPLSVTQAVRITLYVSTEHLLSYSVAGDRNTAPAMHNTLL